MSVEQTPRTVSAPILCRCTGTPADAACWHISACGCQVIPSAAAMSEARASSRALGLAIILATLVLGIAVSWVAYGWTWAAGYIALWIGCVAVVRRLP